ncbi:hypothetical protein AB836_02160 [Rickettsiales bacterium (ex Bugula neritina AB1)]|nr:hypothetical protein AB836_02160 [Rickettsiales bacterium (ex Bugula neritina AB1)]
MLIILSIFYVLYTVGATKILTFFSQDISVLFSLTLHNIITSLLLGSIGATTGRLLTHYFLKKFTYKSVISIGFFFASIFFILEFNFYITKHLYLYYFVRLLQGLCSGIINIALYSYNGILNINNKKKYINITMLLTMGLGIFTPIFSGLYIFFSFKSLVIVVTLIPIFGAIISYFTINNVYLQQNNTNEKSLKFLYKNLFYNHIYIIFFAITFSFFILPVLIILTSLRTITEICGSSSLIYYFLLNYFNKKYVIKIINALPLIIGSFSFFIPKKKSFFYLFIFVSYVLLLFIYKYLYFKYIFDILLITFIFIYSIHIIYIPMIMNNLFVNLYNKEFYGSVIHVIRSIFSIILNYLFLQNIIYNNISSIINIIAINLIIGFLLYIISVLIFRYQRKNII